MSSRSRVTVAQAAQQMGQLVDVADRHDLAGRDDLHATDEPSVERRPAEHLADESDLTAARV